MILENNDTFCCLALQIFLLHWRRFWEHGEFLPAMKVQPAEKVASQLYIQLINQFVLYNFSEEIENEQW